MKTNKLKIACIEAGCSDAGQMVLLEKFEPGCIIAFRDTDRLLLEEAK